MPSAAIVARAGRSGGADAAVVAALEALGYDVTAHAIASAHADADVESAAAAVASADAAVVFVDGAEGVVRQCAAAAHAAAAATSAPSGAPKRVLVAVGSPLAWARTSVSGESAGSRAQRNVDAHQKRMGIR